MHLSTRITRCAAIPAALIVLAACNKKAQKPALARCPASSVKLDDWQRHDAQYLPISLLIPPAADTKSIPSAEGSVGEGWSNQRWATYYKYDSVRVDRVVEKSPAVQDFLICTDTTDGVPGTYTLLYSSGTGAPGEFGQASWTLPSGKGLYMAVLTPSRSARDTVLSVLQSVRFKQRSSP